MSSFNPSDKVRACANMCSEVMELQARAHSLAPGPHVPHAQVEVQSPTGSVEVDAGIVDLLKAIWALNVETTMSCEDNMGSVWVQMQMEQFQRLHLLARQCDDLAFFMDNCNYSMECWTPEHAGADHGRPHQKYPFLYFVSMRFPKQHAEMLLNLLRSVASPGESSEPNSKRRRLAETDQAAPTMLAALERQLRAERLHHRRLTLDMCRQVLTDIKRGMTEDEALAELDKFVYSPILPPVAETDPAGAETGTDPVGTESAALLARQLESAQHALRIANENFEILGAHCEQVLRDVHKKHISAEEGIARIMTRVWEPGDSDSELDSDSDSEPQFCSSCRMKH